MTLGIDFGFILCSFAVMFMLFRDRFYGKFLIVFSPFYAITDSTLGWKASAAVLAASSLIPRFSCTLVSLTCKRLTGAISDVFLISKSPSRFSCTFVSLVLVKRTSVLWPQKKNVERLWILKAPRLDFRPTLIYFGILLGRFRFCLWFVAVSRDFALMSPTIS